MQQLIQLIFDTKHIVWTRLEICDIGNAVVQMQQLIQLCSYIAGNTNAVVFFKTRK